VWNKVIDTAGRSVLLLLCNSHRSEGFSFVLDQYWNIQSGYLTLFYMHALSSLCQSYLMNVPRATPFSCDTICVLYSN